MGIANRRAMRFGIRHSWLGQRSLPVAALVSLVVVLDWITKWAVSESMPYGASEPVVAGFFNLVHVRNTGIAFSLFADSAPWIRNLLLPAVSLAAIAIIVMMFRGAATLPGTSRLALALVLAGAIGNLSERLMHGYVTDFLDVYIGAYHWPAFNIADSAITIGAVLLVLDSVLGRHPTTQPAKAA